MDVAPPPRLDVRALGVRTRRAQVLLDAVDLHVDAGERVALLGASGSGKSLTAASILGTLPASLQLSGTIELDGRPVHRRTRPQRRDGLAAIAQDSRAALNPLVSIGSQIVDAARRAGLPPEAARSRTIELLSELAFDDPGRIARSHSGELSGGQRQRACIALALACRPRLLIADEPTTALDALSQADVVDALRSHTGGDDDAPSLLFITHDLAVAAALCSRAVVMAEGRVVEVGQMATLLREPQHAFTRALVAAARAEVGQAQSEAA